MTVGAPKLGFGRRKGALTYWVCRCGFCNPSEFPDCWQCGLVKVGGANVPNEVVFKCLACGSQFPRPAKALLRFAHCPECGHHYFARMVHLGCGHFGPASGRCEVCSRGPRRVENSPGPDARLK